MLNHQQKKPDPFAAERALKPLNSIPLSSIMTTPADRCKVAFDEAQAFLCGLGDTSGTRLYARTPDGTCVSRRQFDASALSDETAARQLKEWIQEHQSKQRNITVGLNPVRLGCDAPTRDDVVEVRFVSARVPNKGGRTAALLGNVKELEDLGCPEPQRVLAIGDDLVALWEFETSFGIVDIERRLLRPIARAIGADETCTDVRCEIPLVGTVAFCAGDAEGVQVTHHFDCNAGTVCRESDFCLEAVNDLERQESADVANPGPMQNDSTMCNAPDIPVVSMVDDASQASAIAGQEFNGRANERSQGAAKAMASKGGSAGKVKNNPHAAIEFVKLLGDDWGQHFYAILDGDIEPYFVGGVDALECEDNCEEIRAWLDDKHAKRANIYFALNPLLPEAKGRRVGKELIDRVCWIHVDIDPKDQSTETIVNTSKKKLAAPEYLLEQQNKILSISTNEKQLKALGIPGTPTFNIMSGRGRQLIWKLSSSNPIEGKESTIELIESHIRGVTHALGGDKNCWDISRILRLPWTVNFPNKKKIAQGVDPDGVLAELYELNVDAKYRIMDFPRRLADADNAPAAPVASATAPKAKTKASKAVVPATAVTTMEWCKAQPEPLAGGLDELVDRFGVTYRTAERILLGGNEIDPKTHDSRSENVFGVVRELLRRNVPDGVIMWLITNPEFAISEHIRDPAKNKGHRGTIPYAQRQISRARKENEKDAEKADRLDEPLGDGLEDASSEKLILDRDAPNAIAHAFRAAQRPNIIYSAGQFLDYEQGRYAFKENDEIRSAVRAYLNSAKTMVGKGEKERAVAFEPKRMHIDEVRAALAETWLKPVVTDKKTGAPVHSITPMWLEDREGDPDPKNVMSFPNGLLDLETGRMMPSTPRFFTCNMRSFDYDANAPEPTRWLQFVEEAWPGDRDTQRLVQQILGYLISSNMAHDALFPFVGPGGCGKGVLRSVMEGLVGATGTVYPTLDDFGERFGMAPLIHAQLAVVPDASAPADKAKKTTCLARLKAISGRDPVSVERKGKDGVANVRPMMRIVIFANSFPDFDENSNALDQRWVPVPMRNTFRGTDKQDTELSEKLRLELPGILNWAIEGLRDLNREKRFVLSQAAKDVRAEARSQQSPLQEFVEDCLVVDPEAVVNKAELYSAYVAWFTGKEKARTARDAWKTNAFFRGLKPTLNHAISLEHRERHNGPRMVRGVKLNETCTRQMSEFEEYSMCLEESRTAGQNGDLPALIGAC